MTSKAELLPCPFCAAGETIIAPRTYWTGMKSEIISVEVRHWCAETGGSSIVMRGKTEDIAIEKWNRRPPA
jgi:hypothetical protein